MHLKLLVAVALCAAAVIAAYVLFWQSRPADAFGVGQVSAGNGHTCAIGPGQGSKCWGWNIYGELGNGTNVDSTTPVDVTNLSSHVDVVSAGYFHTCALMSTGAVRCWGLNNTGQLGDGTNTQSYTPVDVSGLSGNVHSLSAGGYHTCAIGAVPFYTPPPPGTGTPTSTSTLTATPTDTPTGTPPLTPAPTPTPSGVACWGRNAYGELGNGTNTDSNVPVGVVGLSFGAIAVSSGEFHTCAVLIGGSVKCWGNNPWGSLGDGTNTDSNTPVFVTGLANPAVDVSVGGQFTCALENSGGVQCWGLNQFGQLGNGTVTNSNVPVNVTGLTSGVSALASTGTSHSCVVMNTGGVKCWGYNGDGQLGNGTTTNSSVPVNVSGLSSGISKVATGANHSCALTQLASLKCWGDNTYGELGDGTTTDSSVPVNVVSSVKDSPPVPPCPTPYATAAPGAGGCVTHSLFASLTVSAPALSSLPLQCNVVGTESIALGAVGDANANLLEDVQFALHALSGHIDCPGPIGTGSSMPSSGQIEESVNTDPGDLEFPATATMSLCVRVVTTLLGTLENCPDSLPVASKDPIVLTCAFPSSINSATCAVTGTSTFYNSAGEVEATLTEGSVSLVPEGTTPEPTVTPTITPTPGPVGGVSLDPASRPSAGGDDAFGFALFGAGAIVAACAIIWLRRRTSPQD